MSYGPNISDLYQRAADVVGQNSGRGEAGGYSRPAAEQIRLHREPDHSEGPTPPRVHHATRRRGGRMATLRARTAARQVRSDRFAFSWDRDGRDCQDRRIPRGPSELVVRSVILKKHTG